MRSEEEQTQAQTTQSKIQLAAQSQSSFNSYSHVSHVSLSYEISARHIRHSVHTGALNTHRVNTIKSEFNRGKLNTLPQTVEGCSGNSSNCLIP